MKVLFIAKGQESLSIEYLSSVLKREGHQVELLFDPGLDNILGFLNLKFLKLRNDEWYIEKIKKIAPDIVAFSCLTNLFSFVKEKASLVKRHFSNIPVVVGGIHPTILPDLVIREKDIDMICIGEGEEAFVELLDKMQKGIDYFDTRNFWFKHRDKIIKNPLRPLSKILTQFHFQTEISFINTGVLQARFI